MSVSVYFASSVRPADPLCCRAGSATQVHRQCRSLAQLRQQQQRQHSQRQQRRQQRKQQLYVAALPTGGADEAPSLATEFQSFLNREGVPEVLRDRRPTHLMSPLACIAAQMGALQRNDWPEKDAGVLTAFAFAKCEGAEELLSALALPRRVRSWSAREEYLGLPDFSNQLHSEPYTVLLNFDAWQPVSALNFPSTRQQNKAVCAVAVTTAAQQRQVYTFCLERVLTGPYKNCWVTVGVRVGDYASF